MFSKISLLLESLILAALGAGVGFVVNGFHEHRDDPHLKLHSNYFPRPIRNPRPLNAKMQKTIDEAPPSLPVETPKEKENSGLAAAASPSAPIGTNHYSEPIGTNHHAESVGTNHHQAVPLENDPAPAAEESSHLEHEFNSISSKEVLAVVDGSSPFAATTIILDARDDAHYQKGRVPGAYPLYFSQFDGQFEAVREYVEAGYRLVVYCAGGECEDSLNMCRKLYYDHGAMMENIFLYEGGWSAWEKKGYPIESGE